MRDGFQAIIMDHQDTFLTPISYKEKNIDRTIHVKALQILRDVLE